MTVVVHVLGAHPKGLHGVSINGGTGIDDEVVLLGTIDATFSHCGICGGRLRSSGFAGC